MLDLKFDDVYNYSYSRCGRFTFRHPSTSSGQALSNHARAVLSRPGQLFAVRTAFVNGRYLNDFWGRHGFDGDG